MSVYVDMRSILLNVCYVDGPVCEYQGWKVGRRHGHTAAHPARPWIQQIAGLLLPPNRLLVILCRTAGKKGRCKARTRDGGQGQCSAAVDVVVGIGASVANHRWRRLVVAVLVVLVVWGLFLLVATRCVAVAAFDFRWHCL